MKKLLKFVLYTFSACAGLGFVVSGLEKRHGKPGWAENHTPAGPYEEHIKRPLDFALALMALLFLWPVILIIALMVRKKLGSPVLFTQERPGVRMRRKNAVERTVYASETQMGKTESVAEKQESVASKTKTGPNKSGSESEQIFRLFKFRTMTDERDSDGNLLPDADRLTSFGKTLRATSLDELPELINILKGDMAIVGPRPLLVEYLPRYNEEQRHRHDVRPGLTGYAQAHGRNELSWEERFADDVKYVNHITFCGDIKILADTIKTVAKREGIHSKNDATMEKFTGSNDS